MSARPEWREPDTALADWGDALRRARAITLRGRWLSLTLIGGGILLASAVPSRPLLVWNLTPSAPLGAYRTIAVRRIHRGDRVAARLALPLARWAEVRGYIPASVPLVKTVAAIQGDRICARGAAVSVNGRDVARRLARDRAGRRLPAWQGCHRLGDDEFLLLNPPARSFDGRYFGVTTRHDIVAILVPIGSQR